MKLNSPLISALTVLFSFLCGYAIGHEVFDDKKVWNQHPSEENSYILTLNSQKNYGLSFEREEFRTEVIYRRVNVSSLSRPSCVTWNNWNVHCFYRGLNNQIYHVQVKDRVTTYPSSIGGDAFGDVQCISTEPEKISCIVLGPINSVHTTSYAKGRWTKWINQGEVFDEVGRSSCTKKTKSSFVCVLLHSKDYAVAMEVEEKDPKANFKSLGEEFVYRSSFTCVSRTEKSIDCIAASDMNYLMNRQWVKWIEWNNGIGVNLHVGYHPEPSSVLVSNSTFYVFGVSPLNEIVAIKWHEDVEHIELVTLTGIKSIYSPECVHLENEVIYCFAIGTDHSLYMNNRRGGKWSEWTNLGYKLSTPASCVAATSSEIYCLARSSFQAYLFELIISIIPLTPTA